MTSFQHEVLAHTERYAGPIFSVYTDQVTMSDGRTAERDLVVNLGAVGVVAVDDIGRVVLIRQYRHPVRQRLWELPAGLRDVHGAPSIVVFGGTAKFTAVTDADGWVTTIGVELTVKETLKMTTSFSSHGKPLSITKPKRAGEVENFYYD